MELHNQKRRFHINKLEERIAPNADHTLVVAPPGTPQDTTILIRDVSSQGCDNGVADHAAQASGLVVDCF